MSAVSQVEVAQTEQAVTGESPLWDDHRRVVWWIDIQGRRLLGWHAEAGALPTCLLPSEPGFVALAEDNRLVLGLEDGLWLLDPDTEDLTLLTAVSSEFPDMRLNDGKPDRHGRLWFGSMNKSGSGVPHGALYCRHPGGRLDIVRHEVRIPNAIVVSPDGRTLYFTDSPSQLVLAFDIDQENGRLRNERVFLSFGGNDKPDGATVDADGNFWIAVVHGARIDQYAIDGRPLRSIPLPVTKPTMGIFGGPALSDLFVTSQRRFLTQDQLAERPLAGALLRIGTGTRGSVANRLRL